MCVGSNFTSRTVTHVIREGDVVTGVTSLGDNVFPVRYPGPVFPPAVCTVQEYTGQAVFPPLVTQHNNCADD